MKRFALLLCFWGLLSLSCAQQPGAEDVGGGEEEEAVELFTTPLAKLAAAASDFGYNLFRQLSARDPKGSVLLSPLSISTALTQLSMGASERAEKQLYRALRYHNLRDTQLHDTLRELLRTVRSSGKGFTSVERLLLARRLRIMPEYLNAVEKQYGERPQILMGGTKDLKSANDWFKQQTGGKVERILTTFPRNSVAVPVGAAYFKGKWKTRFSDVGKMQAFRLDGEAPARVAMMQQEHYPVKMGIDSDLSCTIAQIDMENGVSMYVFLPDDVTQNFTLIEEALSAEFVQDLANTLHPVQVRLSLPVLKLSYSTELLPALSDLGLSEWLENTDLTKMTAQAVKLNTVRHKVVMETAPEGARYAGAGSPRNGQSLELQYSVDRPFLFLLRDEASGALMLIGKVLKPNHLPTL